ncbi:MAG: nucleotidyltransferase domain-containing protein [Candidatus Nealsonbacteria bacterium DGGOD1a]|jgi:Nucleotidyltransferase domain.|nr:MAG: nucleotidyltransferase domain-containing protein [Candidatus Nealsonbacteria bacterium DGGOD1a]
MVIKAIREKLTAARIKAVVMEFGKKLAAENIPVKQMILFGSYAKNNPHIDSDIDVAVILKDDSGIERGEIDKITWWAKQINVKLEPHILSEGDFNNRWLSLPAEIKKTGIKIAER